MPNTIPTSNPAFIKLLEKIQGVIPNVMFIWIFITYLITAIINIYFLPLPLWITIPISLVIQGSRFLVIFQNFLVNPEIYRSNIPSKIAIFATGMSLVELLLTLLNRNAPLIENASIFIFLATIIIFGYFMEVNFVKFGEIVLSQPIIPDVEVKKKVNEPTIQSGVRTCLNCNRDLSHRLKMVKYCSDKCRNERFYLQKKVDNSTT